MNINLIESLIRFDEEIHFLLKKFYEYQQTPLARRIGIINGNAPFWQFVDNYIKMNIAAYNVNSADNPFKSTIDMLDFINLNFDDFPFTSFSKTLLFSTYVSYSNKFIFESTDRVIKMLKFIQFPRSVYDAILEERPEFTLNIEIAKKRFPDMDESLYDAFWVNLLSGYQVVPKAFIHKYPNVFIGNSKLAYALRCNGTFYQCARNFQVRVINSITD